MVAPYEVVQTHPPEWTDYINAPAARAWLMGYVRTDVPGYRELDDGGGVITCPSGEYRFDALLDAMSGVLPDPLALSAFGSVQTSGSEYTCTDRLGWLLGFGIEAGTGAPAGLDEARKFVPPACIPLIGATWTQVTDEADRRQTLDRHRRNQGYVWGGAAVWRARMDMSRYALEALKIGWCLRGKVTLGCADMIDTPISSTEPRGAITGYALGLDSVSWLDSIQSKARVEYSLVSEPL